MDVTPMSMQMVVPRATDAGQVQHNLNQANAMQSDFQAIQQKAEDKLKQQQVRAKDNLRDGRIHDDPDHKPQQGGYEAGGKKQQDEAKESGEDVKTNYASDPSRGHFLDISL
jgi:hypothetical protein